MVIYDYISYKYILNFLLKKILYLKVYFNNGIKVISRYHIKKY